MYRFKHKFRKSRLFIIFFMIVLVSCEEETTRITSSYPEMIGISKDITFYGDIVTIYGKNFGSVSHSSCVVFKNPEDDFDTLKWIASQDCIEWANSEITFEVPERLGTSLIGVCVDGYTTEKILIKISPLPEFDLVEIPAGSFEMGSETGFPNEIPMHNVNITNPFYITKFEIRQLLWNKVMEYNPSVNIEYNLPVHSLEWIEAVKFCNAISRKLEYDTCYVFINDSTIEYNINADGYRLPTEAEWEYVCRAGTVGDYYGTNIDELGWYNENSGFLPHPSGQLLSNDFGLYDMHGNVWEWCWDFYAGDYYETSPEIDPTGPEAGERHVIRGGACSSGKALLRSSNRTYMSEDYRYCGLRIVRTKFD